MSLHNLLQGLRELPKFVPNLVTIIVFTFSNIAYIVIMRTHYNNYVKRKQKKPIYYKLFRVYGRFFLSKVTSRSERKFYVQCNIIGAVFGSMIILSFMYFVNKMLH